MNGERIVVVGGSAGSFRIVCNMLMHITKKLSFPVVLVLHRPRNIISGFVEAINIHSTRIPVMEVEDKQRILPGSIYLAPANYHVLCESKHEFALSTDDLVQFSRPSIDVTFESAAHTFGKNTTVIVLSGANRDGVNGALHVEKCGGQVIVQAPPECEVPVMPQETIKKVPSSIIKTSRELCFLLDQM